MIPTIYTYLDYRHFLVDTFEALRGADPTFSFRAFSRMAGSTSPNYLQLIRDRKLNISSAGIRSLSESLKLGRKEESYFETIVAFDHAKTHEEKDKYFQRIVRTREYRIFKELQRSQYEYLSHWYMPVIREMVVTPQFRGDPAWIAERIVPPITAHEAKKGIELLASLGLIRRNDEDTRWVHTDRVVSTPSEVLSLAVTKHTKKIFSLGAEAIERFPAAERDLRGITLGISDAAYGELKERMEAFWKELLAFAEGQQTVDRVYQVNLQLFPMSRKEDER